MDKKKLDKIKKACDDYSSFFEDCLDHELIRICTEYELDNAFITSFKKYNVSKENYPEQWFNINIMQYTAGKIFTKNGQFNKYFKKSYLSNLNLEEKNKLTFFKNNPWIYSLCSIKKKLNNNLFIMYDYSRNREFILQSQGVSELERKGAILYLLLLYFNGECYQTCSTIHYYKGLQPYDFEYFSQLLSPSYERGDDYTYIIEKNQVAFYLLDNCANVPFIKTGKDEIVLCGSIWECDLIDTEDYKDECSVTEKKDILYYSLKKYDTPPHFARFFYNKKRSEMYIYAHTLTGYKKVIDLLSNNFDLDYEPDYYCNLQIATVAENIMKKHFPPQ